MIFIEVIWVVTMFLWLLSVIPWNNPPPWPWAHPLLAFIAVLLLGIVIFMFDGRAAIFR